MTNYLNQQIVVDSHTLNLPSSDGTVALTSQIPEWVNNIKVYSINGKELNIWAYPQGGVKSDITFNLVKADYTLPSIKIKDIRPYWVNASISGNVYDVILPVSGRYVYGEDVKFISSDSADGVYIFPSLNYSIASGGSTVRRIGSNSNPGWYYRVS